MQRFSFFGVILLIVTLVCTLPARAAARPHIWDTVPRAALLPPDRLVPLPDSLSPALSSARHLSSLSTNQRLSLTLSLRGRDVPALDRLVRQEYLPGSALFHHWITPAQFAARFAPPPAQRERIVRWLRSCGLVLTGATLNGLELQVTGTTGAVERAFGTPIERYRSGRSVYYANTRAIHVPQALLGQIQNVAGLSNVLHDSPQGLHIAPQSHAFRQQDQLAPVTPGDLFTLYNLLPLAGAGLHGEGQTIALIEYGDFRDANVAHFDARFGLSAPNIERIALNGSPVINSNQGEAELDIEVAHSIAPAAKLLVYQTPTSTLADALAIWNRVVSDDRANVISVSYASAESRHTTSDMTAWNLVIEEAAAQGQGAFVDSGDYGAYAAAGHPDDPNAEKIQVQFPSSSPYVTAVGGTMFSSTSNGDVVEQAWAEKHDTLEHSRGSGGGLSTLWKRPWYQVGPGVENQYSNGYRQVPDVSALSGYPYYEIYTNFGSGTGWLHVFGTSASTPLWAAYTSLLDQSLGTSVGFLNPTLYLLGQHAGSFNHAPFNDVSAGDNLYYPATPDWDFATGWGSMDGRALRDDLQSSGGAVVYHPVSYRYRIWVTGPRASNRQWPVLHTIHRGQPVYLLDRVSYDVLPLGQTPISREYTLASSDYTMAHYSAVSQAARSARGHRYFHWYHFTVPKNAPAGIYTFTWKMTLGTAITIATTRVQLK